MELTCRMFQCIKKAWLSHCNHLFGNWFGIFFSLFNILVIWYFFSTLLHLYLSVSLEIYDPLFYMNFRCHVSLNARSSVVFCEKQQLLFCTNSENSMSNDLQRQDASIKENICCETVLFECLVNGHYVLSEDTQSIKLCVTNGFLRWNQWHMYQFFTIHQDLSFLTYK